LIQKFASAALSVWLVATLTFFALRLLPSDAIQTTLIDSGASEEMISVRREALGLDQPLIAQYSDYLGRLLRGDYGVSLLNGRQVSEIIFSQLPHTLTLGIFTLGVAILFGLGLGFAAAFSVGCGISALANALITLALSLPIYWTGTIAIFIFVAQFDLLPLGGSGQLSQLILPSLVLGFHTAGAIARTLRTELQIAAAADYALTAYAKGLRWHVVLVRHLFPNALIPVLTVITLQAGFILSGVVVTETIFSRPGLGQELLNATFRQDYPIIQGIVVWVVVVYIVLNTVADSLYSHIDPRLRRGYE
jgi:peptide/nickel transport system permease protein